jgi:4-diphosphocytidyl-2-C-methyl-D-erythritol kinase
VNALHEKSVTFAAPAKINLMLRVVGRRADGYHLLQTVFRFIDFGDELRFSLRQDGVMTRADPLPTVPSEEDLCVRAAKALQRYSQTRMGADIWLKKRIPMGGGLGGGSSDAATTLVALNYLWDTRLTRIQLIEIAEKLGADVPVFVWGRSAFAQGIGEQLEAITLDPAWYIVLIPPVAVSTASIFNHPELKRDSQKVTIQGFTAKNMLLLGNDLQTLVCKLYPVVGSYLDWLGQHAPVAMSGSGACVFAHFDDENSAKAVFAKRPAQMQGFVARGLDCHPLLAI